MKALLALMSLGTVLSLTACMPSLGDKANSAKLDGTPLNRAPAPESPSTPLSQQELSIYDLADGINMDLKESCAESVCGQPPKLDAAIKAQAVTAVAAQMKIWEPKIRQISEQEQLAFKNQTDLALAQKSVLKTLTPEPKYAAMMNFLWALSKISSVENAIDWRTYRIDETKWAKLTPLADGRMKFAFLKSLLNAWLGLNELHAASDIRELGMKAYFERKLKTKDPASLQQGMQAFAKSVRANLDSLHAQFPTLTSLHAAQSTLDLSEGRTIDSAGEASFIEDVRGASFAHVVNDQLSVFTRMAPDVSSSIDMYFSTSLPQRKLVMDSSNAEKKIKRSIEACRRAALHINEFIPRESQVAQSADAMISMIRTQAVSVAATMGSNDETKQAAINAVNAAQFAMPDALSQELKKIDTILTDKLADETNDVESTKHYTAQDLLMMAFATNMLSSSDDDGPSYIGDCNEHDPASVSDHSQLALGSIRLSWATLMDAQSAPGVIAHEMGHLVSSALTGKSASNFTSTYQCVQDRAAGKNTKSTQEEDFADHFSSEVLTALEAQGKKFGNDACLLMKSDTSSRWGASSGLSLVWPADHEHIHSPNLYRLVQIEIDRGHSLSAECSQVVSQSHFNMTNRCE